MLRRVSTTNLTSATSVCASTSIVAVQEARRTLKVRRENFFSGEALPHGRRVSWAPHSTPSKQGLFAKLARSNFYDREMRKFSNEPYHEEEVEPHRKIDQPDIYIYKYNVSPTGFSLRP